MTFRAKSPTKRRRSGDSEDRYQLWVTIGFIALIVLVVLFLVADVAFSYYNDHFKPIANVGGVAITPDMWGDRVNLESYRLDHQENQIRSQLAAGQLDQTTADNEISSIETAKSTVTTTAAQDLLDLVYKSQLAAQQGITASDSDIQAKMTQDASSPERRHVLAIFVTPQPEITGGTPSPADNQKALSDANAAAAALAAGTPFDQVAEKYSTDASKDKGGDYGFITADNTTDPTWVNALFALPLNGTTPVLKGADGTYRIGKVTEIQAGTVDQSYETGVVKFVGDSVYRDQITKEVLADKLKTAVIAEATAPAQQVKLAEILIGTPSGATDQPQVHVSHILYSPGGDPSAVSSLSPSDPQWPTSLAAAQKTVDTLNAITDVTQREQKFAEIAKTDSNDTGSAANGGDLGFLSADASLDPAFHSAIFDKTDYKTGDIIGPVKGQYGYYVIMFWERIPSADDRLKDVQSQLAASGANFQQIAMNNSDGAEAPSGGELGWKIQEQLDPSIGSAVFALKAGQQTQPIKLDDGYHILLVEDSQPRPLDQDQVDAVSATAFDTWYTQQEQAAEKNGVISKDTSVFTNPSAQQ